MGAAGEEAIDAPCSASEDPFRRGAIVVDGRGVDGKNRIGERVQGKEPEFRDLLAVRDEVTGPFICLRNSAM